MEYIVNISYAITMTADSEQEAIAQAKQQFEDIAPRPGEVNYEAEEID